MFQNAPMARIPYNFSMMGLRSVHQVSRLHHEPGMDTRTCETEGIPARVSPVFARRVVAWDWGRLSVMMLPIVPALLLVGMVLVMETETPGARVAFPATTYFGEDLTAPGRDGITRDFMTVYARRDPRAIEIADLLERLGPRFDPSAHRALGALLVRLSEHYGYDPILILAVIMTESSFNPHSRSHKGALGLMQIRPLTGESLAIETDRPWSGAQTLFDPYLNISLGVRYLAKLQKQFGSLETALTAYNYGPARVQGFIERGEPLPTGYARRVLMHYSRLRAMAETTSAAR